MAEREAMKQRRLEMEERSVRQEKQNFQRAVVESEEAYRSEQFMRGNIIGEWRPGEDSSFWHDVIQRMSFEVLFTLPPPSPC